MKQLTLSRSKKTVFLYGSLALIVGAPVVQAQAPVTMDWAYVADAGNAADNSTGGSYGAVDYDYRISRDEVTIGQYTTFLNSVAATDTYNLYHSSMGNSPDVPSISRSGSSGNYFYTPIGSANRPITYVSWFDAARFVNWLANGQGMGDTETGVYELNRAIGGVGFTAAADATLRIPTEDEWYKAAYYDPSKAEADDGDNYHQYATQTDATPSVRFNGGSNDVNYSQGGAPSADRLTDVGLYALSSSYYGTFDQNGNVWEWTDGVDGAGRVLRGGSWSSSSSALLSSMRQPRDPSQEASTVGFRVALVPEPSSVALLSLGCVSLLLRRKRN